MTPSPSLEIRPRRPDDVDACVAVLARVHATDGYPVRHTSVSAGWLTAAADAEAWVALDAGRLVGHVALVPHPDVGTVEVSRLFSDPQARGLGVGAALLDAVLAHAGARGERVVLEVVDGTAAVEFYRRRGWRPTGTHVAEWVGPDGTHPVLRTFAAPA